MLHSPHRPLYSSVLAAVPSLALRLGVVAVYVFAITVGFAFVPILHHLRVQQHSEVWLDFVRLFDCFILGVIFCAHFSTEEPALRVPASRQAEMRNEKIRQSAASNHGIEAESVSLRLVDTKY